MKRIVAFHISQAHGVWSVPILVVFFLVAPAGSAKTVNISGDWSFKLSSPEGEHAAKLTVTQKGEEITGFFSAEEIQIKMEGTIHSDEVQFAVRYTGGDEPIIVSFHGKLDRNQMTGDYKADDVTGIWSAERAK